MWQRFLWLSIAGAIGTLARYSLVSFVQSINTNNFPLGTLLVNLTGCFLFGFVFALAEEKWIFSNEMSLIILIGFMGAFTTFSTYAFESFRMLEDKKIFLFSLNFFLQNFFGILFLFFGRSLVRLFK